MILFITLLSLLIGIAVIAIAAAIIAGGSFIIVFGDVIAFVAIIWLIVKLCRKKK